MADLVSIILPTLDEEDHLAAAIASARMDPDTEIVVADGGSSDGTVALARKLGAQVIEGQANRAEQLNAGAAQAHGKALLFLHADTLLPAGAIPAVRAALAEPKCVGGAFRIRIGSGPGLSVVSWGTNARARWFRLPYGDQALFVSADSFARVGGYRAVEIMEDVDFVRRLRRIGRLAFLNHTVHTSARRWRARGLIRTTLANTSALTLYKLGVAPGRIRRLYDALAAPRNSS